MQKILRKLYDLVNILHGFFNKYFFNHRLYIIIFKYYAGIIIAGADTYLASLVTNFFK
jgi:hypothetical protein